MIGNAYTQNGKVIDSDRETAENFGIDYIEVWEFIAKYDKAPTQELGEWQHCLLFCQILENKEKIKKDTMSQYHVKPSLD